MHLKLIYQRKIAKEKIAKANILKTIIPKLIIPRIIILKHTKDKVYNIRYDTYCFTK